MKLLSRQPSLHGALLLGGMVCLAVLLLAGIRELSSPAIDKARHALLLSQLGQILPASSHDNDPAADRIEVLASPLGSALPQSIYRARLDGTPTALVISTIAPTGYSGRIHLLVAYQPEGEVLGVRVVSHRETPGLGDIIDASRSDWIHQFDSLSVDQLGASSWAPRADGGQFDLVSGATVSTGAVLAAVRRTLAWAEAHAGQLFRPDSGQRVRFDDAFE